MTNTVYLILCGILSIGVLLGIRWMSAVKTAVRGNLLSSGCMFVAVITTLYRYQIISTAFVWVGLVIGTAIGLLLTFRVTMIAMPQTVALLNGLGGAASAIAAFLTITSISGSGPGDGFSLLTAGSALAVGSLTFSGSMIAAGKLHKLLTQKPVILPAHQVSTTIAITILAASVIALPLAPAGFAISIAITGLLFGILFAIRVGGADMPITISLLNSTSGVAAAIAGMAIGDILLVSVGGIVGASGLLLTQIMCRAMNRNLSAIIFSKGNARSPVEPKTEPVKAEQPAQTKSVSIPAADPGAWLREAQNIIVIPGYGMALSQAQGLVKQLTDRLEELNKQVRFAIHPVAGRMPGHMNVLLCEVDVPYEKLFEMDAINPDFAAADLVLVVGANDVINPAANTAKGTPIYGMPVLAAIEAKRLIVCNFDLQPGYAGVPNPLYEPAANRLIILGDAKESLKKLLENL